jgi:hypothetical protein
MDFEMFCAECVKRMKGVLVRYSALCPDAGLVYCSADYVKTSSHVPRAVFDRGSTVSDLCCCNLHQACNNYVTSLSSHDHSYQACLCY